MDPQAPNLVPAPALVPPVKPPWYSWRRLGYNFLTLSVVVHLLLGAIAAYVVVSVNYPRKKSFMGAPTTNPSQHAVEHKVSMAKTQQRSSAPVALARVVTKGVSKVALPAMPAIPVDAALTPVSMTGMGGRGLAGFGAGGGGGGNGGGGGGNGPNFFGARASGKGLVGTFYDLKQTPNRQPTAMDGGKYLEKAGEFVRGGFNDVTFAPYYKAPQPMYADRIFTPNIPAELGPAAFGVQKEVEPRFWVVHYKGTVIPPASGTYHFVGMGDDLMLVRFNGRLVLNGSIVEHTEVPGQEDTGTQTAEHYAVKKGPGFQVEEGHPYPMDVLIGECPGGWSEAVLMIVMDGTSYTKDGGRLLAPIFRLSANTALPVPPPGSRGYVAHAEGGPVWKLQGADAGAFSVFSH